MMRSGGKTRSILATVGRGLGLLAVAAAALAFDAVQAASPLRDAKLADLRGEQVSPGVRGIAEWAMESGDHDGLPFVVIDKVDARVYVFDAEGRLRGSSPALVGAARGDETVPGIGSRPIRDIRPEERTTPAGRFTAVMGRGPKGEDILWVDYDNGLALHRVVTSVPAERRLQRLASNQPSERRITYGCINVPVAFYETVVGPTFAGTRGIVYILPESKPVGEWRHHLASLPAH